MFEHRSDQKEVLDRQDCDPAQAAASYRFMEKVNRWFGGTRHVLKYIEAEADKQAGSRPLRILDIGSGSCDIAIAISQWAKANNRPIAVTCLEISGPAIASARTNLARADATAITLVHDDIFDHTPEGAYDCAISSMCFHHFNDRQIREIVQRLSRYVRRSLLITDLHRTMAAWLGTAGCTIFSEAMVRHDSRLSIRRGFRKGELQELLKQTDTASIRVTTSWLFRIHAVITFTGDRGA